MRARFEAEGDVIVITGGANGIGRALACAAADAGAPSPVAATPAAPAAAPAASGGGLEIIFRPDPTI